MQINRMYALILAEKLHVKSYQFIYCFLWLTFLQNSFYIFHLQAFSEQAKGNRDKEKPHKVSVEDIRIEEYHSGYVKYVRGRSMLS